MPSLPASLYYPAIAVAMFFFVICFIPKEKYPVLFWISLFWGFFFCHFFIFVCGGILKLFRWAGAAPFEFLYAPLFVKTAWLLAMMIYFYFLPKQKEWYVLPLYIAMFSFISAALDAVYHQMGLLVYFHWNPFLRFLAALGWFSLATVHYRKLYPAGI